ncbi:MAG: serine/threonine protein kinase [Deltaproteobacteria bacterium]|nr:serine/threonine protein kinase [Deltaproteobacteria bacterium]
MSGKLPAEPGEQIGGYQLQQVLGQGGMGCVFLATHTRLGRKTALKMLAPELVAQEEYVSRFLSEAKIVNDVRHPNIVDIYDFIELESPRRVAYVMELIEGGSLSALLRQQRLSLRQAVNVSLQLASALEAVHSVGVVHRDLKPDNVLVVADPSTDLSQVPSVKVLDFGIAKSANADVAHKTITGSMLGTPSYMAPEQIAAQPVSAATDVYALGEIFYEMVSGIRLFKGEPMKLLGAKLAGDLPELKIPEDCPAKESVEELVRWCVQVDSKERPSMHQLAGALTEILAMEREPMAPETRRARPPARPRPPETMTPANLASMVALTPAPAGRSLVLPIVGVVCLLLAGAIAFWVKGQAPKLEALPMPPPAPPAAVAPPPAPAPPPVVEASPPPVAEPEAPVAKPERKRPRRIQKPEPAPDAPQAPRVVKKRELVPW